MPVQHTIVGGDEPINNEFWDDYVLNFSESILKRFQATQTITEQLVVSF